MIHSHGRKREKGQQTRESCRENEKDQRRKKKLDDDDVEKKIVTWQRS